MTYFMAYVILLSAAVAACAMLVDVVMRSRTSNARWVWLSSLMAVLVLAGFAAFAPVPVERATTVPRTLVISGVNALPAPAAARQVPRTDAILYMADSVLPGLWLISSLFLLLAIAYGQRRLTIERTKSPRARVSGHEVLLTDNVGPAVAGVGDPVILLPRWVLALDAPSQDLLLAHEVEHVKRADTRLLLGGAVAAALVPWNPVVWWIARRLRLAVEQDCDARVLRAHPDVRRYADLLLTAASKPRVSTRLLAAHLGEHRSDLDRRIQAMTDRTIRWRPLCAAAVAACALLVVSCEAPRPEPVAPLGTREVPAEPSTGQYEEVVAPTLVPGSRTPKYPEILREAGVEGQVLVSFDIDETGKADIATLKVIKATHELFATAVREALPAMRFRPAERDGRKVKLTVQEPFTFTLADTKSPQERVALTTGALQEIVVTGVPAQTGPTIALRRDGKQVATDPPHVVVYSIDGREVARGQDLLKQIEPQSIHSIEVYKPSRCPASMTCPWIKITLAKDKSLGGPTVIRPARDATRDTWEPKAETAYRRRPSLDSILAAPMTIELLNSDGEIVARYGSRREMPRINGEDISASESYHGRSCKAGTPCPLTRIRLKPGREARYKG
ncbi:MAG TPA: M56 family metallopeptidase [Gemmatimonadaceae bacterium]|nr:M56 family metallopeptidase [Gemmatimonadaceae bacterium]